ncbi:hypothetical protein EV174_002272 [Coemansia sp. RSA 2320]|nr:hypothetical protein EV174_002272 [Coemansia sp. RSA 2320]
MSDDDDDDNSDDNTDCSSSMSTSPDARIVGRSGLDTHQAVLARVREARRLVDDLRFDLHPMDPPPWCDARMELTLPNVHSFQLPDPSWQWVSPRWLIDMTQDVDEDGWQYASRFSASATWHGRHSAANSFVRRRRWLRLRRRPRRSHHTTIDENSEDENAGTEEQCCYNLSADNGMASPAGQKPAKKPIAAAASKIKSKVSGNYVGSSPKSPTGPAAKALAYTLKDGKYRSHSTKPHQVTSSATIAPIEPASPSPLRLRQSSPLSSGPSSSSQQQVALHLLRRRMSTSSVRVRQHGHSNCSHHRSRSKDALLPLPTGGFAAPPLPASLAASTAASETGEGDEDNAAAALRERSLAVGSGAGYVDGIPSRFPRLLALAPPTPSVPLSPGQTRASRSPEHTALVRPEPLVAKHADEDAGSTVVASRTDMSPAQQPHATVATTTILLRKLSSASSSLSSYGESASSGGQAMRARGSLSSIDYVPNDLPCLDPYVDPYISLQLPVLSLQQQQQQTATIGASECARDGSADDGLVKMTASSLKHLLSAIPLDRERLDCLREGLNQGGITAATVWYCLPFLHFDLLQFDAGRQRLIAMLLTYSHTCPVDAPLRLLDLDKYCTHLQSPLLDVESLSVAEKAEFKTLVGCPSVLGMSPSQAWRFVVRPLVARDADLFYSDFKLMVMGVAKWSLSAVTTPRVDSGL